MSPTTIDITLIAPSERLITTRSVGEGPTRAHHLYTPQLLIHMSKQETLSRTQSFQLIYHRKGFFLIKQDSPKTTILFSFRQYILYKGLLYLQLSIAELLQFMQVI